MKNNYTRYALYAFGEIILIVFGILIALQIDNWNQSKLKREKEIEMLKLLKADLVEGISEFDRSIAQYAIAKNSIRIIVDYMESNRIWHDSLKQHFFNTMLFWGTSDLSNSTFETLKSLGTDLISNEDLRNEINIVFDEYDSWIEDSEGRYLSILVHAGTNILNSRFYEYWSGELVGNTYVGEMIPLNYESLKGDHEYVYFLKSLENQMKWLIEEPILSTKDKTIRLIGLIDNEHGAITN